MSEIKQVTPRTVSVINHLLTDTRARHTMGQIQDSTDLSQATVHHILARLTRAECVSSELTTNEYPRRRYYKVAKGGAAKMRQLLKRAR